MGLNYNPSIIVNGLQYALDPGNTKCYPGSGNTAYDLSGQVGLTTLTNGPTYNSNLNGFISFDGTNDYLAIPDSKLLDLGTEFTISAWVKLNDLTTVYHTIFNSLDVVTSSVTKGVALMWFRDNSFGVNAKSLMIQFGMNAWAWNVYSSDTNTINDLNIHHVVVTISAANTNNPTVSFYLDGVLKTTTWWGQSTKTAINYASDTSAIRVGHLYTPSNGSYYNTYGNFNVYNLQIYKRALSATEITQNYYANRGRYSYNFDIVTSGLTRSFDVGNYLTYPGSGNIIYSATGGTGGTADLRSGLTVVGSGSTAYIDWTGTNGRVLAFASASFRSISFVTWISSSQYFSYYLLDGRTDIANSYYYINGPGVWTNLYINGSKKSVVNLSDTTVFTRNTWLHIYMELPSLSSGTLYFGNRYSFDEPFTGRLAAIQFYNKTLSQSEIIQNYDAFRGRFS